MNDKIYALAKKPWFVPVVVGVSAFGSGIGIGYMMGLRKRIEPETYKHEVPDIMNLDLDLSDLTNSHIPLSELVREETVDEQSEDYQEDDYEDQQLELNDEVAEKIKESMTSSHDSEEEIKDEYSYSDFDYEEELQKRDPTKPYIISHDEFWAEELGFTQTSLTYYSGDDILADEDDKPIYNYKDVVGELKFGYGSDDPNIFYVRNEKRRSEYEIMRIGAIFSQEVLGLDIEDNQRIKNLKHSKTPKFKLE